MYAKSCICRYYVRPSGIYCDSVTVTGSRNNEAVSIQKTGRMKLDNVGVRDNKDIGLAPELVLLLLMLKLLGLVVSCLKSWL